MISRMRQKAVRNHRDMWTWIAEQSRKYRTAITKSDYRREQFPGLRELPNQCWLCQYTYYRTKDDNCRKCPLEWESIHDMQPCIRIDKNAEGPNESPGLYKRWKMAVDRNDWRQAAELAERIANLPERV